MELCAPLKQLRNEIPAVFAGTELDRYTGGAYRWRTLQNEKSRGEAPADMFLNQGQRKCLLVRDKFLPFWQSKLSQLESANKKSPNTA